MADAFRGLTIRLGADARPLNSALASVKGSASAAQSQMNKLTRALNGGAIDAAAMSARIALMGDKIALTAREAMLTKSALSGVDDRLKSAVASGKNFYAATQKARMELKDTDRQLQVIHDALTGILAKSDKFKDMSRDDAWKAARNEVLKYSREVEKSAEAQAKLRNIAKSLKSGDIPYFIGENNIVRANKLIGLMKELKTLRATQDANLSNARQEEEFAKQTYNLAAYNAELKKAIAEQTKFQMQWKTDASTEGLEKATNKIRSLDAATDAARQSAQKLTEAFRESPTSRITAEAKFSALRSELEATESKASALKEKMRELGAIGVDKALASSSRLHSELTKVESDYSEISAKVAKCAEKLAMLTEKQEQYKIEAKAGNKGAENEYKRLEVEIKNVERHLDELVSKQSAAKAKLDDVSIANAYKKLNEELVLTEAHMAKLQSLTSRGGFLTNAARSIRTMGYGLYSTLTPAILIAGRYAIQAADDVDSAYRDMRKTVNGTEEDFVRLRNSALEFGRTHVTGADTLLEIEAMGGQLGIAVENLDSFAESMSNLEVATDIEAEDISKYAGQLSNIMHDIDQSNPEQYKKDITSFSDALVRLGNNSAAQESSIMKVMMRIASLGEISGFSTPQLLAISTAVAATGQGCEAAGTAISKTFSNIQAAVSAGGDSLSGFAKVAGMSAEQFAKSWKETPNEAFTAFIGGLTRIRKEGGDVDGTLAKLGINSVRQKQALEGLTNTFDVLTQSTKMSEDAWNGMATVMANGKIEQAGDAAREAQAKAQGFSGQLKMMKNAAQELGVQLLEGAVPIIMGLGSAFQFLTGAVSGMPDIVKKGIVETLALAAALGPAAVAIGAMVDGISKLKLAYETFKSGRIWASLTNSTNQYRAKLAETRAELERVHAEMKKPVMNLAGVKQRDELIAYEKELKNVEKSYSRLAKTSKATSILKGVGGAIGSMVGVTVAFAAVDAIVAVISDAIDKTEKWNSATVGLNNALSTSASVMNAARGSVTDSGTSMAYYTRHLANAKEAIEKTRDANIELSKSITESMEETGTKLSKVDSLRDAFSTIAKAGGHLSEDQLADVKMAVDAVNEACNESFSVAGNAANGYYIMRDGAKVAADSINELCDSLERQIKLESFKDLAQSAESNLTTASVGVAEAQKSVNAATDNFREHLRSFAEESGRLDDNLSKALDNAKSYEDLMKIAGNGAFNDDQMKDMFAKGVENANVELEKAKQLYKEAQEVANGYKSAVKLLTMANDENASAMTKAVAGNEELMSAFMSNGASITDFKNDMEALGISADSMAKFNVEAAARIADAYKKGDFSEIGNILDSLGIKYDQQALKASTDSQKIADEYVAALSKMSTTSDWFTQKANQAGFLGADAMQRFSIALSNAGLSAEQMIQMGTTGFDSLLAVANNDVNQIAAILAFLNSQELSDKQLKVTENGIEDVEGKVWKLDAAARTISNGEVTFKLNEDGSVEQVATDLEEIDNEEVSATVSVDGAEEVAGEVEEASESVEEFDGEEGTATISEDGADEVQSEISDTSSDLSDLDGNEAQVYIYANDRASGVIESISDKLANLDGSSASVTVYESKVQNATGSIFTRAVRSIPKHADGGALNGIVTRATLTNAGWVGEAGTEAIINMKHAGGAIIPLSNRHYVRPFARAVASEMGGVGSSTTNIEVNLQYSADADARQMARDLTRELQLHMKRGA